MKRIVSILLVVLLVASLFVACGGSDSPAGTYSIKSIDGKTLKEYFGAAAEEYGFDVDALLSMMGIDLDHPEDLMSIIVKDDGTVSVKSTLDGDGETQAGTWKLDGDKMIITVDGEDQEFTFKNGELTATMDDSDGTHTMVLGK